MKIKIENLSTGKIKIELTVATDKKPLTMELEKSAIAGLVEVLNASLRVEKFRFELEL